MEVKVLDLLEEYHRLRDRHGLVKQEEIVENIPLEPVWKQLSTLFLEKIKHLKKCSTVKRSVQYSLDLNQEQERQVLFMCFQLIESGDTRISEKVSQFLAEFLVVMTLTSEDDGISSFLNQCHSSFLLNKDRQLEQRPAFLGSEEMIDIDATTGWQRLESLLRLYHSVCLGFAQRDMFRKIALGEINSRTFLRVDSLLSPPWFEIAVEEMSRHSNRHFREMTFHFLGNIFPLFSGVDIPVTRVLELSNQCLPLLLAGLEDDWSQIRYAATRAFDAIAHLLALHDVFLNSPTLSTSTSDILVKIAPRICLNRFHPAKSIQSLSVESWKTHFGREGFGRQVLCESMDSVVSFYTQNMKNKNHMICEAACLAVAEILTKLPSSLSSEVLLTLKQSLLEALRDERWPVRDAALLPSGSLFHQFGEREEATLFSTEDLEVFLPLWRDRLQDSIWSVRENAAMAFAEVLQSKVFSTVVESYCRQYLEDNLLKALHDSEGSLEASAKTRKITSFLPPAMLQPALSNSSSSKTHESTVRTGLRKGWGCCIDCAELRSATPWEISHGALYLTREMYRSTPTFHFEESLSFSLSITGSSRRDLTVLEAVTLLIQRNDFEDADKLHVFFLEELPALLSVLQDQRSAISSDYARERILLVNATKDWMEMLSREKPTAAPSIAKKSQFQDDRLTRLEECRERLRSACPSLWEEISGSIELPPSLPAPSEDIFPHY